MKKQSNNGKNIKILLINKGGSFVPSKSDTNFNHNLCTYFYNESYHDATLGHLC